MIAHYQNSGILVRIPAKPRRGLSQGRNSGKHVVQVSVRVRFSGGSSGLMNTRITQRGHNGLSWFGPIRSLCLVANDPYTQKHPKSRGVTTECKGRDLVGGVSSVLILRLPHRRWSLPSYRRGGRRPDAMEEELSVPLPGLPCPWCRAGADGMEWSVW
jgi:hypothetical protein